MSCRHSIPMLTAISMIGLSCANLSAERYDTSTWVGSNYTPAFCVNQVQLWHEFKPEVIDRELAAAKKYFGIKTLRVFLHNIPYNADKEDFLGNIEQFLAICDRHGIKPGFVFFDDCWQHSGITLTQKPPVDGLIGGNWAACPQDVERTDENLPKFKAYVQDVIRPHRTDDRVLWWEIFNEPKMALPYTVKLRKLGYQWAKQLDPIQPVTNCWDDSPETDLVDAHNYSANFAGWDRQADLNPNKGAIFTEAGARWYAGKGTSHGEPIEIVDWLKRRKEAGKTVPGVYLCWEVMVGNVNARWIWGSKPGTREPTIPWCGLLWPDGTPVSLAEAEAVRSHTTGEHRALLFDDFQNVPPRPERANWTEYGSNTPAGRGVFQMPPERRAVTGDTQWTDYVVETVAMLKDAGSQAGLLVRANNPGPGRDDVRGYYVGFTTTTLHLGKMNYNWKSLATFDLTKLESKVEPGAWNLLRVAIRGNRIRVYFNRLHDDDGLRIDYTDREEPVPSGNIGLQANGGGVWFDNVVVLPIEELPSLGSGPR